MKDTSHGIAVLVENFHARLSPAQRVSIAAGMHETACKIVWCSLPAALSDYERRLFYIRRMYGAELPEAAYHAFASQ